MNVKSLIMVCGLALTAGPGWAQMLPPPYNEGPNEPKLCSYRAGPIIGSPSDDRQSQGASFCHSAAAGVLVQGEGRAVNASLATASSSSVQFMLEHLRQPDCPPVVMRATAELYLRLKAACEFSGTGSRNAHVHGAMSTFSTVLNSGCMIDRFADVTVLGPYQTTPPGAVVYGSAFRHVIEDRQLRTASLTTETDCWTGTCSVDHNVGSVNQYWAACYVEGSSATAGTRSACPLHNVAGRVVYTDKWPTMSGRLF